MRSWQAMVAAMILAGCFVKPDHSTGTGGAVSWVQPFYAKSSSGLGDNFTAAASSAGDAVVFHVACTNTPTSPTVTLVAPGWPITPIGWATLPSTGFTVASFGAIAPDTKPATFDETWSSDCPGIVTLADEFANTDPTGEATTFESHAETVAAGGTCVTHVTADHAGAALWAACTNDVAVTPGAGFDKGADANGDISEHTISSAPAGTDETLTFDGTINKFAVTAVTLKP